MISSFNIVKLESLLKDFYNLTHIRITVFNENFKELIAYPFTIAQPCQMIRTNPVAAENCIQCDRNACQVAKKQKTPYIYQCHAGFTEAISPIRMGNIVIGYLFFGHVFSYKDRSEGYQNILLLCKNYQIDADALLKACDSQPMVSKDYILSASRLLEAVASYLCFERMVTLRQQELPVQIDIYINEHLSEKLSIQDICDHFQIGKTQLCELAKRSYGKGIAAHIRDLRIDYAKELLLIDPDIRISDVASLCGFDDYNYFIDLFKRTTGLSPKHYQHMAGQDYQ